MFEIRIQIEAGQRLTLVEMAGNVAVTTWDEDDVLIRLRDGEEQDLTVEQSEDGPVVSARLPCEVKVPAASPVTIRQALANLRAAELASLNAEQVRGNLKLSGIAEAVIAEVYGALKAGTTTSLRLVGTVYGNVHLNTVPTADLQNVRGNLLVKGADCVRVSRVSGNLQAKALSGSLDADQVGGNAVLKGIAGVVTLDQVAGNLLAKDLTGGAKVPKIGGNLMMNGEIGAGCTYHFKARGNAVLRLPEEANAHLTLIARGQLQSSLKLVEEEREENQLTGTLGDGGAEIVVEAGGNVMLGGGRPPFADMGEEISRQVEESLHTIDWEGMGRQVEESLRAIDLEAIGRQVGEEMEAAMSRLQVKLEGVDWDRVGHRTQRTVERAMERMQRDMDRLVVKAERGRERLERMAEREERIAEREARRRERLERKLRRAAQRLHEHDVQVDVEGWPGGANVEAVESGPDLDEERLSILKMVEQGQITPEEAEMLLDALE
jgi:hypothetical protein